MSEPTCVLALVACYNLSTLRTYLVLMHSIVNGYQLLCDAHTLPKQHRVTTVYFFLITIVLFRFFFLFVCHSDSPISFLGVSIVCVCVSNFSLQ